MHGLDVPELRPNLAWHGVLVSAYERAPVLRQNLGDRQLGLRLGRRDEQNAPFSPIAVQFSLTETVQRVPGHVIRRAGGAHIVLAPTPRRLGGPSGGLPLVAMVEAADFWSRHDAAGADRVDRAGLGRVFAERQVSSGIGLGSGMLPEDDRVRLEQFYAWWSRRKPTERTGPHVETQTCAPSLGIFFQKFRR